MPPSRRVLQLLEESIVCLQTLASGREPLEPQKLGRLFGDLFSIQRSMRKLKGTDKNSNRQFWQLERRAAALIIKIAKHLSTS